MSPDVTSIQVSKEVARLAKIEAAKRGVTLRQIVEDAIRVELKKKVHPKG